MAGVPIQLRLLGRPYAERDEQSSTCRPKRWRFSATSRRLPAPNRGSGFSACCGARARRKPRARTCVTTLWTIRKQLGNDAVGAQGDRLSLGRAVAADVRKLTEAPVDDPAGLLALYRGPFLDGLSLTEAPDFELWLAAARESYAQAFLRRAGEVLAALTERGAWAEIVEFARGALDRDPTHESIHRSLMAALAATRRTRRGAPAVRDSQGDLAVRAGRGPLARDVGAARQADAGRRARSRPSPGSAPRARPAARRPSPKRSSWAARRNGRRSTPSWRRSARESQGGAARGRAGNRQVAAVARVVGAPCRLTAGRSKPAASRQRAACRLRPSSSFSAATRACRTCFTARRRFRRRGLRRSRGCCRSSDPSHRTCLAPPRSRPKRSGGGSSRHSCRCFWRWMPGRS